MTLCFFQSNTRHEYGNAPPTVKENPESFSSSDDWHTSRGSNHVRKSRHSELFGTLLSCRSMAISHTASYEFPHPVARSLPIAVPSSIVPVTKLPLKPRSQHIPRIPTDMETLSSTDTKLVEEQDAEFIPPHLMLSTSVTKCHLSERELTSGLRKKALRLRNTVLRSTGFIDNNNTSPYGLFDQASSTNLPHSRNLYRVTTAVPPSAS